MSARDQIALIRVLARGPASSADLVRESGVDEARAHVALHALAHDGRIVIGEGARWRLLCDDDDRTPGPVELEARARAIEVACELAEANERIQAALKAGKSIEAMRLLGETLRLGAAGMVAARDAETARKAGR